MIPIISIQFNSRENNPVNLDWDQNYEQFLYLTFWKYNIIQWKLIQNIWEVFTRHFLPKLGSRTFIVLDSLSQEIHHIIETKYAYKSWSERNTVVQLSIAGSSLFLSSTLFIFLLGFLSGKRKKLNVYVALGSKEFALLKYANGWGSNICHNSYLHLNVQSRASYGFGCCYFIILSK